MVWPSANHADALDSTLLVVGFYILGTASEKIMLGPDLLKDDNPILKDRICRLPVTGSRSEKVRCCCTSARNGSMPHRQL